ncbi:MAG: hypothetical protein ACC628_12650 [Pirellulaceae bacterium]
MSANELCRAVVCCVFAAVTCTQAASADTIFRDTFSDGDAEDGMPVTWTPTDSPGIRDAVSGDYVFTPVPESEDFFSSDVLNVILEDTSIRSRLRVSGLEGSVGFTVRNQSREDRQNYFGGIGYFPNEGGTAMFLGRNNPGGSRVFFGNFPVLPFDIRNADAMLQLDVIGNELKLWGWRAGDPIPGQPQLVAQDDTYASGFVGIFSGSGVFNQNIGTFRYVHVADMHIPEPPTLVLAALAWLGMLNFAWRPKRSQE